MESKSLCLRDDFRFFTPLCYVQNDRMSTLPSPPRSTNLDKIFDQALILWCGMVTCGRAEIPVLGRDMGALGFKFPTTHRAYGGEGSEFRRAEGGMVRSSEGTQRRSFSSLG